MEGGMASGFPRTPAQILVAEDDALQAAVIRDLLAEQGYLVRTATSLAETRVAIRAEAPDLLLLDRMLPDGDGSVLCAELKQAPLPAFPIILLTARDRIEDRIDGLMRGADDYIPKPFNPQEFLARVHGCLRTLGLQRELQEKAAELAEKHEMLLATQVRLVQSQRLAAIGEIGLAIRHEINNPLGTILGFTDLLLAQAEEFPEPVRRKLDAIRRSTLRIRDVVKRLEDIQTDRTVEYVAGMQMTDLRQDRKRDGEEKERPPAASGQA
jgi:DNA-binding response OmpR family regulator